MEKASAKATPLRAAIAFRDGLIINALKHHLMEPELFALFCDEYTRHMNKLRAEATASLAGYKAELAKVTREMGRLVDAITEGAGVSLVKDRMLALETHKLDLERLVRQTDEPPPLLHPNMAVHYRRQVARLQEALTGEAHRHEAAAVMRTLVDKIVLHRCREGPRLQCRSNCTAICRHPKFFRTNKKTAQKGRFSGVYKSGCGDRI